jgi:hypothetical protein
MRISSVPFVLLALAGCGGADPSTLCADGACDQAFARITRVDVSSPGGSFRVLRDGLSERRTFATGAEERGVALTREQLAPLWLALNEPALHADLQTTSTRSCDNSFGLSRRCLEILAQRTSGPGFTGGCWCGTSPLPRVEAAWQEALVVFDAAFPE